MKTEILNQKKEFKPIEIKITLESQEEVDLLWDIGNISRSTTFASFLGTYCSKKHGQLAVDKLGQFYGLLEKYKS